MDEIRQNGKAVLKSNDGISIAFIFNNLVGVNFNGNKYKDYIHNIAIPEMKFKPGRISLYINGKFAREGTIPNL